MAACTWVGEAASRCLGAAEPVQADLAGIPVRPVTAPGFDRFELGDWQVDAAGNRLLRGDEVRPLRHKAMALLVLLAQRAGQTVARDEIVQSVWNGNRYVADKAINTAVWTIRQALGDEPDAPRYLQTIPKKGYRLVAPVRLVAPASDPTSRPVPARARPRVRRAWAFSWALLVAGVLASGWWVSGWWAGGWWASGWWAGGRDRAAPALSPPSPLTQYPGQEYLGRLSPDGRWLAFAWWQGQGAGQLYLREAADQSATTQQISGDTGEVQGLAWAPDGQSLAYLAASDNGRCALWVYRLTDRSRRELAACAPLFTPAVDWSPDGRWIAFSAVAEGAGGLFLIAPDGSGLRRLTTAPPAAMPDHQPAWAADGQRLAFVRQDPADGTRDLYETSLDGPVRRLSTLHLYRVHGLSFAADGQDLIYSTTQQDDRVLMRWQRAQAQAVPMGVQGSAPALSADGRLVYALLRTHVSIARLDGPMGVPQRLISSVGADRAPDVDRHAGRVVFVSGRSGHSELWWADADGRQARALTRLEGLAGAPTWAPAGDRVAFLGNCGPGRRHGLCQVDLSGAAPTALATDAANYGRPAWHPQAPEVWVASDRGGRWQLWRFAADGTPVAEAVATERPPGRALQWSADGRALVYQPRFSQELRWRPRAGGAERPIVAVEPGDTLVDWRMGPQGLVVLSRGQRERFWRIDPLSGRRWPLSEHPLGTFPEFARLALGADGAVWVELADTASGDLMQLR
jgi:Tol biopolymer transport system component/DNA-binding winged helix-turn-helix (wHTH) protein